MALRAIRKVLVNHSILKNALQVSLAVGILLNAINQGPALIHGLEIAWGQFLLNFIVPFGVASYSAAKNELERNKDR